MKKILFLVALLILSLIAIGQIDNTKKMSNYEKYVLAKQQSIPDTIYKINTVYTNVKKEKPEYDDLYYIPSKNELKCKAKDIRLEKKKLRIYQDSLYYDAKEEVYNDLSNYYTDYRFFSFRPSYYYRYNDPFYYDPWLLDSWYWEWGYPYYNHNYPYYYNYFWYRSGYHNWYFNWESRFPYYPYGYNYNNYYVNNNYYGYYNNRNSVIQYRRRERPSNLTNNYVNRGSVQTQLNTQEKRTNNIQSKPIYNQNRKRTYTPLYERPHMNIRSMYNNTKNTNMNKPINIISERRKNTISNNIISNSPLRGTFSTPVRRIQTPTSRGVYSAPTSRKSQNYSRSSSYSNSNYSRSSNTSSGSSGSSGSSRSSSSSSYSSSSSGGRRK